MSRSRHCSNAITRIKGTYHMFQASAADHGSVRSAVKKGTRNELSNLKWKTNCYGLFFKLPGGSESRTKICFNRTLQAQVCNQDYVRILFGFPQRILCFRKENSDGGRSRTGRSNPAMPAGNRSNVWISANLSLAGSAGRPCESQKSLSTHGEIRLILGDPTTA